MKNAVKLAVTLAIGAVCLWLAFRGVSDTEAQTGIAWSAIADEIASTSWWGYAAFVLLFLVQVVMRTERWRIQVRGLTGTKPGLRTSLALNGVGFAAVFLLPFRLGEFVRPNMGAARGIMPAAAGLANTILERALDGIVTTGCFGVLLFLLRDRDVPAYVRVGGWTALVIFGGALAFFVVAYRWRAFTQRTVERLLALVHGGLAKKIGEKLREFLDGLACFRKPSDLFAYLALTVGYWFLNGMSMVALLLAMHIDVEPIAGFFCLCFLVIGVMIPAPPGNVGNFHAFARAGLAVFKVAPVAAVSYAIVLHAATVLCIALYAAIFFVTGDVTASAVKNAAHKDTPP
ncbi:MAG TPA: lysylphosphatidylglycerol synthase transmembrane domain-containing protein [Myxococcota bacterium]